MGVRKAFVYHMNLPEGRVFCGLPSCKGHSLINRGVLDFKEPEKTFLRFVSFPMPMDVLDTTNLVYRTRTR